MSDIYVEWFRARWEYSEGHPAREFFLELDEATMPPWLERLGKKKKKSRLAIADSRLRSRMKAVRRSDYPIASGTAYEEVFLEIDALMEGLLVKHFRGRADEEMKAFEAFAAGQLRQVMPQDGPGRRQKFPGAPDSANVFLFAELGLAWMEIGERRPDFSRRWSPRLNMFTRIQDLFLKRWEVAGKMPTCFHCFDGSAPILDEGSIGVIRDRYDRIGHSRDALVACIDANLRRTKGCSSPFEEGPCDRSREFNCVVCSRRAHSTIT